jgi:uncharacterized protein (DUF58 family)
MVSLKLPDNAVLRALRDWKTLLRTARPVSQIAVLDRRHVYILPTRQGVLFTLVLVCMLIGSINYALSLGFALTFLLAGLGVIAMLHTWRNLAGITLTSGRTLPVFAGEEAQIGLVAAETHGRSRYAIAASYTDPHPVFVDIPANDRSEFHIAVHAARRGWLRPGRLTVHTEFPLGLFRAWSYVELDYRVLVYPRPAPPEAMPPMSGDVGRSGMHKSASGDDDFAGLRHYIHGDSLRRIDWKASSREQGLYTKQFQGASSTLLWLDWQLAEGDTEARISQLTRWVLDAHAAGVSYGLRLPGSEFPPDSGEVHFRRCLETLALFGSTA